MIPKKIHYCWFGKNPLPELAKNCINSWKKNLPDYEIIEWNEDNFDINSCTYIKEAYQVKKYAFVSDYVRLYVLVNYGGIYMDTDVEVIKSIDQFLEYKAFSGFETKNFIPTGIMACEKNFELFNEFLDDYKNCHFIKPDGTFETISNVVKMTNTCKKYGLILNDKYQIIRDFALFPSEYFCPKRKKEKWKEHLITENTYTIHHFAGSWLPLYTRIYKKILVFLGKYALYIRKIKNILVKILKIDRGY